MGQGWREPPLVLQVGEYEGDHLAVYVRDFLAMYRRARQVRCPCQEHSYTCPGQHRLEQPLLPRPHLRHGGARPGLQRVQVQGLPGAGDREGDSSLEECSAVPAGRWCTSWSTRSGPCSTPASSSMGTPSPPSAGSRQGEDSPQGSLHDHNHDLDLHHD